MLKLYGMIIGSQEHTIHPKDHTDRTDGGEQVIVTNQVILHPVHVQEKNIEKSMFLVLHTVQVM
jgi:hypothetical protein